MQTASVQDGEQRLAHHQYEALASDIVLFVCVCGCVRSAQAKAEIAKALNALQSAQNELLASKLESAILAQRDVELEALNFTKNVNSLYQRAAKWKSEQKRLRGALEGMDKFEDWATATEIDLQGIAGNFEYVCSVLEKEQQKESNGASSSGSAASAGAATNS